MKMRPYWLIIEKPPKFSSVGLGVGVTAYSEDEAKSLFASAFGTDLKIIAIQTIQSMDEVEQDHVRPNMGNFLIRGIWYPLGYEKLL